MARLRTMQKEVTLLAENRGHALFLWRRHPERDHGAIKEIAPPSYETPCARCGETFKVEIIDGHRKAPHVCGPVNCQCALQQQKGGAA